MLARCGLNRHEPRAARLIVLAANVPDIDMLAYIGGPLTGLEYHRGITHALALAPAMAILPVIAVRLFSGKPMAWVRAWMIAMLGLLSHLFLDFTNSYGVRLGLPFTDAWFHLDAMYVADPYVLAALSIAVLAPALGRLVNSEIGSTAATASGGGWAAAALLFLAAWIGLRVSMQSRALAMVESRMYQGETPRRTAAWPTPFSPFVWAGYADCDSFQALMDVNALQEFDPASAKIVYRPENSPALEAARRTPELARFLAFAAFPITRITPASEVEGGTRVEVSDARFERQPSARFLLTIDVDPAFGIRKAEHRIAR